MADIEIPQGATWLWELQWLEGEVPVNLTGYTARMDLRKAPLEKDPEDDNLVATFSSEPDGGITFEVLQGRVLFGVHYDHTSELPSGRYLYDLELTSPEDVRTRLVSGHAIVTPEVTR